MANVFEFSSYKDFLKALISENKEKRGFQATLAKAASCQPSYLSQVLTVKSDLLPDQAIGIAEFLQLGDLESEFFLHLVGLGRASSPSLKKFLEKKLQQLKASNSKLKNRLSNSQPVSQEIEKFYYSSWMWTAIHIATSVTSLQTIKGLSERLSLPPTKVRECLETLEKHGLVKHENGKWTYAGGASHLPPESVMTELNHSHWRQRSVLDIQKNSDESLHYTSVVSMSETDAVRLREVLIHTISQFRKISEPSPAEEVYCFSLDFNQI
jgi:uncharacterized protein (TIGR02147 family)